MLARLSLVRHLAVALVMLLVLAVAAVALKRILAEISWADVRVAINGIAPWRIAAALGFTVASYVTLTGYDVVSLRLLRRKLRYRTAALASFTSYIFSHNLGFAVLTGGTARLRIYGRKGLVLSEVAQIMLLTGLTFWLGVLLLLGLGLAALPNAITLADWSLPDLYQRTLGALILAALAGLLLLLRTNAGRPIRLFRWSLVLPSWRMALVQYGLAAADLCLATAALFVLVPDLPLASFPFVVVGYLLAFLSGLLTHAPGGVGVFEAVMLLAIPQADRAGLFAALLVFRLIYYLIPLAIGVILFIAHEIDGARPRRMPTRDTGTPRRRI
ncbi:lysylphosphatidylglycerol synthase domain-containing protein [Sphingomonas sp.]|uniref:lysylphosphatidylglycerol synthase domain-containing protein n=1 Tax=Sphingomonas sp. TaxID=28214 RepID=UPI002FDADD2E